MRKIGVLVLLFGGLVVLAGGAAGQTISQLPTASRWNQPRGGWLYVLDVNSDTGADGNVLLVDPQTGSIKGSAPVGYAPEMALSPDGARLYFAATTDLGDVLFALDTATGHETILARLPYRWRGTIPSVIPQIALSSDGRWLYALKLKILLEAVPGTQRKTQTDIYTLVAYDTKQGTLLPTEAHLPGCVWALLVPVPGKAQVQVFCSGTNSAYLVEASEQGLHAAPAPLSFPQGDELRPSFSSARPLPGGSTLVVMKDGRLIQLKPDTWAAGLSASLLKPITPNAPQTNDRLVLQTTPPMSPDGTTAYIPISPLGLHFSGMADEIWALDTGTLGLIKTLRTTSPFGALEVSAGGRELYALNRNARTLTVIDTNSGAATRVYSGIGEGPVMAVRAR